jgi:hypothetical protein
MLPKALPGHEARTGDTLLQLETHRIGTCCGASQFGRVLVNLSGNPQGLASEHWERYTILVIDRPVALPHIWHRTDS